MIATENTTEKGAQMVVVEQGEWDPKNFRETKVGGEIL